MARRGGVRRAPICHLGWIRLGHVHEFHGGPASPGGSDSQRTSTFTRSQGHRLSRPSPWVYGGHNLEKASANERQGEAFAILQPGLPKQTPIRITLELAEQDAKAIECIEGLEKALAEKESQAMR